MMRRQCDELRSAFGAARPDKAARQVGYRGGSLERCYGADGDSNELFCGGCWLLVTESRQ